MNEHLTDKLIALAETVAGEAWPMMVRYTIVDATVGIGFHLILLGVVLCFARWFQRLDKEDWDEVGVSMSIVYAWIGGVAVFFIALWGLAYDIIHLLEPGGATLRGIIG